MVYLEITGKEKRIPFRLEGDSVGPSASFGFDVLDIGEVYLHSVHRYNVDIINRGDILAPFSLMETESFTTDISKRFSFSPSSGVLDLEGHTEETISIDFIPNSVGPFHSLFYWEIKGANKPLILTIKGFIMPPTCEFDKDELYYGLQSIGFTTERTVNLVNTSEVPTRFEIFLIDNEGEEFKATQQTDTLLPFSSVPITVTFTPQEVRRYKRKLVAKVKGVPNPIASLTIEGECQAPFLQLISSSLAYNDCFIGLPYEESVRFENDTDLPAQFELVKQHRGGRGGEGEGSVAY
jgi:hydrocephalus-inducing protein